METDNMESTTKRKRKEDASSNDDDGNIASSLDSLQGLSATEYLAQVSQQAKSMPDIFVDASSGDDKLSSAKKSSKRKRNTIVPIDGSAASLSYLLSGRASLAPAPSQKHLPDNVPEWTRLLISNFEQLRDYLEECRNAGVGGRQSNRHALPPMKDRASWHIFCVGSASEAVAVNGTNAEDNLQDKLINNNAQSTSTPPPAWRAKLPPDGYTPTTQLLCQMDQVMIRRVLSHLTHLVHCGVLFNHNKLFEWIYALLARLEKPIHRDDAAMMFGLLKDLCQARYNVDCDDANVDGQLRKLNTLIGLIGVYFEQGGGINGVFRCT